MSGFIYIWMDTVKGKFYVGCHWGSPTDKYVCSSAWMKRAYRHRPQDFKRRIIQFVDSQDAMFEVEQRYLSMIKPHELGTRYYNLKITRDIPIKSTKGQKRSPETVARLSATKIGELNPMFGKTPYMKGRKHSVDSLSKISENRKGKGTGPRSEETRKRMSEAQKGRTFSPETRLKMSLAAKNRRRVA